MTAPSQVRDKTGVRNGRLVVVRFSHTREGRAMWLCLCDCGRERVVAGNSLRATGTRSCGCLHSEAVSRRVLPSGPWNDGKSYAIGGGAHCYKSRASWAKAAIRHYGNACESCGWSAGRCDVHHRHRKSDGGLHTLGNARVLCPNCHRVAHESEAR